MGDYQMGIMTVERMESKNPYQGLFNELKEEYGLSPIEAKALVKRVEQFKEDMSSGVRDYNQIVKQFVVNGEPAGKRIRDCRLIPVTLTMNFNGEENVEQKNGLSYFKKMKVNQLAWEAYEQGGLLSYEDIESILGIRISTIKRYVPGAKLKYATRLKQMLKQELGYQGKPKILDLLAGEIENITN
jgi:hypothetical protein